MFIQDVKTALYGMKYAPEIYGGRYGLGSKDVTSGMVLCRKYRLRYFRNIDKSTLQSGAHG